MEIGKTLKYLRTNKNFTKKALATGIMSPSFYTRIENGDNSVTIELFLQLLQRLGVSFDEFKLIANDFQPYDSEKIMNNIIDSFYAHDLEKLTAEEQKLEDKYTDQQDDNPILKSYILSARLAISQIKNELPSVKDTSELFNLLFSVGTWTHTELALFINTLDFFNLELILLLSNKLLDYSKKYSTTEQYSDMFNAALVNLIVVFLDHRALDEAAYFITLLKKQTIHPRNLYDRNMLLYLDGLRLIILEHETEGLKKVTTAIEIFDTLGMSGRADMYRNDLEKNFNIIISASKKNDL